MSSILNGFDDRNAMLDNTLDLVLTYELYNSQTAATLSSIFSLAVRNICMREQNNDFKDNFFK
jgi:hypothetical protein